jgi:hypothetical protein
MFAFACFFSWKFEPGTLPMLSVGIKQSRSPVGQYAWDEGRSPFVVSLHQHIGPQPGFHNFQLL